MSPQSGPTVSSSRPLASSVPTSYPSSTPPDLLAPLLPSPTTAPVLLPTTLQFAALWQHGPFDREQGELLSESEIAYLPQEQEDVRFMKKRQLPFAEGYPDCNYVGNGVLSCYPEGNTTLVQDVWSKFIWNAQYPTFIGAGTVDIYLYHSDSETIARSYLNVTNAQGMIAILPDDDWLPVENSWTPGRNLTWPFFFVIVPSSQVITGGEEHQSTFTVVQTAAPTSLVRSSSLASGSHSTTLAPSVSVSTTTSSPSPSNLQANSPSSYRLPAWAIALLVVFGVLSLASTIIAAYFCLSTARSRSHPQGGSHFSSEGGTEEAGAPMLGRARSPAQQGALTRGERAESLMGATGTGGAFSDADAAIMAEAFRSELRRPASGQGV